MTPDLQAYLTEHHPDQLALLTRLHQDAQRLATLISTAPLDNKRQIDYLTAIQQITTPLSALSKNWSTIERSRSVLTKLRGHLCTDIDVSDLDLNVESLTIHYSMFHSIQIGVGVEVGLASDDYRDCEYYALPQNTDLNIDINALMALNPNLIGDDEDESLSEQQLNNITTSITTHVLDAAYFELDYLYKAGTITQEHFNLLDRPASLSEFPPFNFQ